MTSSICCIAFSIYDVTVNLGEHDIRFPSDSAQTITIEDVIVHENFNDNNELENDIALIYLDENAIFTSDVQPACKPQVYTLAQEGIISGWGNIQEGTN